jgi:hypothetical protein
MIMSNLAQAASSAVVVRQPRSRLAGWSLIASGIALVIAGEAPFFPPSLSLYPLLASVVLFLGMIPVAVRLANGAAADNANMARTAEVAALAGILGSLAATTLAPLGLLTAVRAEILATSSLGVIGLWLILANALALRARLFTRVLTMLGALGILAGLGMLLAAVIMWIELTIGNLGGAVSVLESVRSVSGSYVGELLYLIWAVWLGIWLVRRKW